VSQPGSPWRVIVTRPAAQAQDWVQHLRAAGLDAQALPLIDISPVADPTALREAWEALPQFELVMFVSANAVDHFFAAAAPGQRWPEGLVAAVTGPGTAAALRAAGVAHIEQPAADAAQWDSEALWARLANRPWQGRRVLVVRGEDGRDWLADALRGQGAEVAFVAAYRRGPPQLDAAGRALLARAREDAARTAWLFSSSEAVAHLRLLAPAADWSAARALATHPRIAQAAREAGFKRVDTLAPGLAAVCEVLLS
jgi:uroporphyrinogen-III synthase